jgi:hypothetical protein
MNPVVMLEHVVWELQNLEHHIEINKSFDIEMNSRLSLKITQRGHEMILELRIKIHWILKNWNSPGSAHFKLVVLQ